MANAAVQQPFKPYHQIATFAPSKEDILNTLEFFFGKPAQPEKLHDFSEYHAATYDFPDAYIGKNVHLRDTLNNLILSSPQDWQTTVALPWMKIEGVTVQWDEVHFDVRLLQRVPVCHPARPNPALTLFLCVCGAPHGSLGKLMNRKLA